MPLTMQGQTGSSRGWILAITAVVLAALVLRWRAFSPFDISHADELMQYLEQAKRLALENPIAVATIVKGWVNGDGS